MPPIRYDQCVQNESTISVQLLLSNSYGVTIVDAGSLRRNTRLIQLWIQGWIQVITLVDIEDETQWIE